MSVNDNSTLQEQLPIWMRQAMRGNDWGAILIIGYALLVGWSFITFADISATTANEATVYRITDTAQALGEGTLNPRWSPHALNGYGTPIPHYYPSGVIYLGGLISFLFSLDSVLVLQLLYMIALIISGSMVYTFVTQRTNALAGLVSGVVYLFSPHIFSGTSQVMGDLSLTYGVALLPALLWATNRLLTRDTVSDIVFIALIIASMTITLPVMLLQGFFALIVLLNVEFSRGIDYKKIRMLTIGILIGMLTGAIYWLPAIVSASQITWHPPMIDAPDLVVRWQDIFSLYAMTEPRTATPYPTFAIGWVSLISQFIFLGLWLRHRSQLALSTNFFLLGLFTLCGVLWIVPTQSTWIILVILCFAISGSSFLQINHLSNRIQQYGAVGIICFSLLLSIPNWVLPVTNAPLSTPTASDQIIYEQQGWGFSGLPAGRALPSYLSPELAYQMQITDDFSDMVSRIDIPDATLTTETSQTGVYNLTTDSPAIIYQRAYFDLWDASIGDVPLEVLESANHQVEILLPSNIDEALVIQLAPDDTIRLARLLSGMGIISLMLITVYRLRYSKQLPDESLLLKSKNVRIFAFILLVAGLARGLIAEYPNFLIERFTSETSAVNYERPFSIQNSLQFIDFYGIRPQYNQGDYLEFDTIWTLEQATQTQFVVDLQLIANETNEIAYSTGYQHIGYIPTDRWQSDVMISHPYRVQIPNTIEAGNYTLQLHIFDCSASCDRDGITTDQAISIIPLPVTIIIN